MIQALTCDGTCFRRWVVLRLESGIKIALFWNINIRWFAVKLTYNWTGGIIADNSEVNVRNLKKCYSCQIDGVTAWLEMVLI